MKVLASIICLALVFIFGASAQDSNSTTVNPPMPGYSGLQCYACSSFLKAQSCDDPNPDDTPIQDCRTGEDMCRKIEQHIIIHGDDTVRTYRECARSGDLGKCNERTGTNKFKSWYCQCKGKLCNGAEISATSFTLIGSMVATLFLLKNRV